MYLLAKITLFDSDNKKLFVNFLDVTFIIIYHYMQGDGPNVFLVGALGLAVLSWFFMSLNCMTQLNTNYLLVKGENVDRTYIR